MDVIEALDEMLERWEKHPLRFDRDARAWTGKDSEAYRVIEKFRDELVERGVQTARHRVT